MGREVRADSSVEGLVEQAVHAADAKLRKDLVDVYSLADQRREANTPRVSPGRVTAASRLLR